MKLKAVGVAAIAETLVGIGAAGEKQLGVLRQLETLVVRSIDMQRAVQHRASGLGRMDLDEAALVQPLGMARDPSPETLGQKLTAQAQAQIGFLHRDPLADPIELAPDVVVLVV